MSTQTPKYLESGIAPQNIKLVVKTKGRKSKIPYGEIETVLRNGKKFVLPITINTENSAYKIRKTLNDQMKTEKVQFAEIEGTQGTKTSKPTKKNPKGKVYKTAQFAVFMAN